MFQYRHLLCGAGFASEYDPVFLTCSFPVRISPKGEKAIECFANTDVCCNCAGGYFCSYFLKNEWPNRSYRSLAYKQLCSALFLVVGLCAIFHAKNYSAYSWLVLGALVGSFIGDALLHYEAIIKKKQFFLYGMIAFALSHILYLAAYAIAFSRLFPGQSSGLV